MGAGANAKEPKKPDLEEPDYEAEEAEDDARRARRRHLVRRFRQSAKGFWSRDGGTRIAWILAVDDRETALFSTVSLRLTIGISTGRATVFALVFLIRSVVMSRMRRLFSESSRHLRSPYGQLSSPQEISEPAFDTCDECASVLDQKANVIAVAIVTIMVPRVQK